MTAIALSAGMVVVAYFLGSIPTGVLIARSRDVDLRQRGSGNIGATNVARTLGKRLGAMVLVLDALKGAVPALAVSQLAARGEIDPFVVTVACFAAIGGHCFPVWLGFRGGKGVATALGIFLVVDPMVTAIAAGVFLVLYKAFHIASIGSMAAALTVPILQWILGRPDELVTLSIATALLILFNHRGNILRLVRRREHRV